jgi:hypothetical protein
MRMESRVTSHGTQLVLQVSNDKRWFDSMQRGLRGVLTTWALVQKCQIWVGRLSSIMISNFGFCEDCFQAQQNRCLPLTFLLTSGIPYLMYSSYLRTEARRCPRWMIDE